MWNAGSNVSPGSEADVIARVPTSASAQQELADQDRGHEPLQEVSDAVEVIAFEPEPVLHPHTERHLRVGVVSADEEDRGEHERERVRERSEPEPAERGDEDRDADQRETSPAPS